MDRAQHIELSHLRSDRAVWDPLAAAARDVCHGPLGARVGRPDLVRLREDLRRALAGTLDVDERLARRESYYSRSADSVLEARVEFVVGASQSATVVEVRTYDRPATLFHLARAIADCGVDVVSARADSMGSSVVDVFYLRSASGAPLNEVEKDDVLKRLQDVVGSSAA